MKSPVLPSSRVGRLSMALAALFVLLVGYVLLAVQDARLSSFTSLWNSMMGLTVAVIILSLATGFSAWHRAEDHAIVLRIVMGLGIMTMLALMLYSLYVGD